MKRIKYILLISLFIFISCSSSQLTTAKLQIQSGNFSEAKRTLEKLISNNELHDYKKDEVYYLLGVVEGELNEIDEMLESFNNSEKITSKFTNNINESKNYYWAIYFNKAVEHFNKKEYAQAKTDFETALKMNPSDENTKQNYERTIGSMNENNIVVNISQNNQTDASIPNKKDIDGFQNFKWGLSLAETKKLLADNKFGIAKANDDDDYIVLNVSDFIFQEKESILKIDLYKDKIYEVTVHFTVSDNTAGMNEYFAMADLIKDIYGETRMIAIGPESDEYNHRVVQIGIGDLSYQHIWNSLSGNLIFQLSKGTYGSFICSLFYSSKDAKKIDEQKFKSEF